MAGDCLPKVLSNTAYKRLKDAADNYRDLKTDYDALKKSSVPLKSYSNIKKRLMDAMDDNKTLTTRVESISNSYSGLKGKYNAVLTTLESKKESLTATLSQLQSMNDKYKSVSQKYDQMVKTNATSLATMSRMKIEHSQAANKLLIALEVAKKEADIAKQEAQVLTEKIAEIEKNEKMARESSLTQALVNTRDFVFDNTIAGVNVSENQSRGLAIIAGAAVAAYMMTRVS